MSEFEQNTEISPEFFEALGLPGSLQDWERAGYRFTDSYPMRITPHCARLIGQDLEHDPIARQFLPRHEEDRGLGTEDPLEEGKARTVPGLIHQYSNRVLLMPTGRCAVNCRHCNRRWHRETDAPEFTESVLASWVDYLKRSPDVTDVLITGGDPLTLPDDVIEGILDALSTIPHLQWTRLGTRIPSVQPERMTPRLAEILGRHRPLFLQVQFNSVPECTPEGSEALAMLLDAGVPVQNQMVLLQGVNDSIEALSSVCHWLVRQRCRPYYLFVPERVRGTSHFWVSLKRAADLAARLRRMLSGLAMPLVVVDTPHGGGKVPLFASMLRDAPGGVWVTDLWGRQVFFQEVGESEAWGEATQEELG